LINTARLFTDEREYIKSAIARKGYDVSTIDRLYDALSMVKEKKTALDGLRRQRNAQQSDQSIPVDDKRALRDEIARVEKELSDLESQADELLYDVPNLPDDDAPDGADETGNVVIASCGDDYFHCSAGKPLPHWDLGKKLDILDIELASKISGSMFGLFKGKGSKLIRALVNYGFELHDEKYIDFLPPHLVNTRSLTYTGHLPKFANDQYKCKDDDLWLIPTAEVPLTAAFADSTFPAGALPMRGMGYTVAFRREAGSAGKETRGLQRVHEFHKVELLKIVEPEQLETELQDLLQDCLKIIKALRLQYRIVDLCAGDMGDKYGRCYDIEVFSPGVQRWLEVSSVGHFSDYQARRANMKYVDGSGKKQVACTMNGSGIATPRVWAAIIETYQQDDGSVLIPEVLVPFMGCDVIRG
jgi:seryl-tRNA synthetase